MRPIRLSALIFLILFTTFASLPANEKESTSHPTSQQNAIQAVSSDEENEITPNHRKDIVSHDEEGNLIIFLGGLQFEPLVAHLYYEQKDISAGGSLHAIYDDTWHFDTGFTTGVFTVGINGLLGENMRNVKIDVAATPLQNAEEPYGTVGHVQLIDFQDCCHTSYMQRDESATLSFYQAVDSNEGSYYMSGYGKNVHRTGYINGNLANFRIHVFPTQDVSHRAEDLMSTITITYALV